MKEEKIVKDNIMLAKMMGYRVERKVFQFLGKPAVRYNVYKDDSLQMSVPEDGEDTEKRCWDFVGNTVDYHKDWNRLMKVWFKVREICIEAYKVNNVKMKIGSGAISIETRTFDPKESFEFVWLLDHTATDEDFKKVVWVACAKFARFHSKNIGIWDKMEKLRKV